MNIKAIVFDADGVVINSPRCFSLQYQKDFGVSNEAMLPFFKGVFQDCLVGKADLKEELKKFLKDLKNKENINIREIVFFDDQKENVDSAKESGWQSYRYNNFDEFQDIINKI